MSRLASALKWLYPGMRVKRWLLLVPIGVFAVVVGVTLLVNVNIFTYVNTISDIALRRFGIVLNTPKTYVPVSLGLIFVGLALIFVSIRQVIGSITSVVSPETGDRLADLVYQRRYLAQGQRVVVIGGGTGLSTMLRGLKEYTSNIVAIVTVTDDGGSSGVLHRELGMLPPGDIRNCLVALADAEPLMTELFQYRFNGGGGTLQGHSFGNLLIAAMTNITGDFEKAVKETSRVLAIRGRVLPSTVDNVALCAEMEDGTLLDGETSIAESPKAIKHIFLQPSEVNPLEESVRAIEYADAIVIGPGSVYTSIIPNLLVKGIVDAITASDAVKVYVCNVMTQPGETTGYSASDHVQAVIDHAQRKVFGHVLVNRERPREDLLRKYAEAGAELVKPDAERIREMGFRPVVGNYISQTEVVRHDPHKLAEAIFRLMYQLNAMPVRIVLASASPRRKELLALLYPTFEVIHSSFDESRMPGNLPPTGHVLESASAKAKDVSKGAPDAIVIGADTVVVCEDRILGKPKNVQDAKSMLGLLSGKTHQVITGICVIGPGGHSATGYEVTDVTFRRLSEEMIDRYVATGEPMDKAGAYAIQGRGAPLIESIRGDYFNVVGLPIHKLSLLLERFGVEVLGQT